MTQEPHLTCTECGRTFEEESLTAVDGELLCSDCLSATTVVCRDCGGRILRSENAGTDAHPLCAYCRDEDYTYCDHCGRLIHNSNAHYFEDDDDCAYNAYIADKNGSAKDRVNALATQLREIERKINNTVNLMIDIGSSTLKAKLTELEQTKDKLQYELSEAEAQMKLKLFSEEEICRLFHMAEEQLKNGTLTNRRMIIDQYINKVLIFPHKIEIYMNLMPDYVVKEVVDPK